MLKIATVVQQIQVSEAVSEKELTVITKMVLNLNKMVARVHRPLKVIAFNSSGIWRWCYELSKHLQDLLIQDAIGKFPNCYCCNCVGERI
jgi:hypothetical protein